MNHEKTMDAHEFAELLEREFGVEPPHASATDDLRRGKRRLRRRRAGASLAALSTAAVVTVGASLLPTQGTVALPEGAPAAGGAPASDEEIVATCMRKENVGHAVDGRPVSESAALALMGSEPKLMTSASGASRTHATLLSADGKYWGKCQFAHEADAGVKNAMSVYSTDIAFPRTVVDGVDAYEPAGSTEQDLMPQVDPALPELEASCSGSAGQGSGETGTAACREFTMHWGDRRPAEVAAALVATPDGVAKWADVRRGYVSFVYSGTLTPEQARRVAEGETLGAQRIVFYDKDGDVLVDDRQPEAPRPEGTVTIAHFPSLAWWAR